MANRARCSLRGSPGWAMSHGEAVVLEDIYADDRILADGYPPTFVQSLVMVPIGRLDPIGAIGNYWATRRRPSDTSVRLLQVLADSTANAASTSSSPTRSSRTAIPGWSAS